MKQDVYLRSCGECMLLVKDDGTPYCLSKPLYTHRMDGDCACPDFIEGNNIRVNTGGDNENRVFHR